MAFFDYVFMMCIMVSPVAVGFAMVYVTGGMDDYS
jgi:hypothetical protein